MRISTQMLQTVTNYILCGLFCFCSIAFSKEDPLCKNFILVSESPPTFSNNEKILICGDETGGEWSAIPESQSLFHLKTFLQERGIYQSTTEKRGDRIFIHLGKPLSSKSWHIVGAPKDWPVVRLRGITGRLLTPNLLDLATERVTRSLESFGYGCPIVKTEAVTQTGEIITRILSAQMQKLLIIEDEKIEGLNISILDRYNPTAPGEVFNRDLILLSEHRIRDENLFQSTYSNTTCEPLGVRVYRKHIAGAPRLFTFGFGLNTEKGPIARIAWKHLRLGENGSRIDSILSFSLKSQELASFSNWYLGGSFKRFHLRPLLSLKHENENTFERYTGELSLLPATSWDNETVGLTAQLGPSLNFSKSIRGLGPSDAKFLALKGNFIFTSHLFELYRATPREGAELALETLATFQGALSPVNAERLNLRFTYLYNLNNWDTPFLVVGVRGALGVTLTPEAISSNLLPSTFRFFLGGSDNIRGFQRLEIPGERGGFTSAFTSVEVRSTDLFQWPVQPLLFVDGGMLGENTFSLDPTVYWSPGTGLRWDSPIGVFRGTFARGFVDGPSVNLANKWTFYLSYGEEF